MADPVSTRGSRRPTSGDGGAASDGGDSAPESADRVPADSPSGNSPDGMSGASPSDGLVPSLTAGSGGPSSRLRWVMFNVALPLASLAVGGLAIWALGTAEPSRRPAADTSRVGRLRGLEPVRVTPIRTLAESGESLQLRVDGTVVPFREVQVATEVAGRIIVKSDECAAGNYVSEGELLVRIDPTDYELEVERLSRQLEQAYEALREVDQDVVNTRRLIEIAEKDAELQSREVKRLDSLPSGFASQGERDQARRAELQAGQQLVTYQNQLDSLDKRRKALEASERLAATQLRVAKVNLKRTEIRAPMDGVVVREDAELNSFVARGNPIVTIEDTSKVEVSTSLRMDQLYWVMNQAGRSVSDIESGYELPPTDVVIEYEMSGRAGAIYRWEGRLLGYDGIGLDPQTRTVPVRVIVDDPQTFRDDSGMRRNLIGPTTLVRGMFVRVLLKLKPQTDLWVIPALAMKPGNRIWLFGPDESLLDAPPDSEGPDSEGNKERDGTEGDVAETDGAKGGDSRDQVTSDGQTGTTPQPDASGFDPSRWIPGRVRVVDSILPVDSISPTGMEAPTEVESGRSWICEDRSGELRTGAMVVVSPLGSFDEGGIDVRAEFEPGESAESEQETTR